MLKLFRLPVILTFLLIVVAGAGVYAYTLYQQSQSQLKLLKNPQEAAKFETQQVIDAVGKLISLPSNETPTIATVTDAKKLKNQPFFAKASNGDKVLIYTTAKKAILYNPSQNKIVDVAPVNIDTSKGGVAGAHTQLVKVAIYNGTTKVGLTNSLEDQLKKQVTNIDVVKKDNAKKSDYSKTLIVDLTGKQKDAVDQLAKLLNGQVANLPDGEAKPDADLLIIVGK